jgi:RHS repeat-associated protein
VITSAAVNVTVNSGVAQVYYIVPDHLNTPRMIADGAGTTVWRWDQGEPFGNDVPNNTPSGAGAFEFNLRFPGQYFDQETGAAYNYFRDYDPAIGRYIQSDPIGLLGGTNTYAYVNGNSLVYADPEGTYASAVAGIILGGIGGGLGAAATGGDVLQGIGIGAAVGGLVGLAAPALPGLTAAVSIRIGASALGNLSGQGLSALSDPCVTFNTASFIASLAGGAASGLRAAGVASAGLPSTGIAGIVQRSVAGISGAASAATIGIIGTGIGRASAQSNANCCDPANSNCCDSTKSKCCPSTQ